MADYKNYDAEAENDDLKSADAEKSSGNPAQKQQSERAEERKTAFFASKSVRARKKKLPIAADLIIAVLMVAIAIGIVAGGYTLFRYFSDEYESTEIEYTFIRIDETAALVRYRNMKNADLYIDGEGNTQYLGRVVSSEIVDVDPENGISMLKLVIETNAKYKHGEGYSVGEYRIAVGSDYLLRSSTVSVNGTIVEINTEIGADAAPVGEELFEENESEVND